MDRVLLVGGAMLLIGLTLAGVFVILNSYGSSFETIEDNIVRWLNHI